jgi:hypothetical protein
MSDLHDRPVSELWWEGEDLHIVMADGDREHYVFEGAYVKGTETHWEHDEDVIVRELTSISLE